MSKAGTSATVALRPAGRKSPYTRLLAAGSDLAKVTAYSAVVHPVAHRPETVGVVDELIGAGVSPRHIYTRYCSPRCTKPATYGSAMRSRSPRNITARADPAGRSSWSRA